MSNFDLASLLGIKLPQSQSNIAKLNSEISSYILGETSPYYKYFHSKEDEKKENLVLLYESIYKKRLFLTTFTFFVYNISKSLLWRRGYFAYFFYHTRNMSFVMFLISLYLLKLNFNAYLINSGLMRYYEKRQSTKLAQQRIDAIVAKQNAIQAHKFDNEI